MQEYLYKLIVPQGATFTVPIPNNGGLLGVYSPGGTLDISWVYNGIKADLKTATSEWEPLNGFRPRPTSSIAIKNGGQTAVEVSIRMFSNGE